MKPKPRPVELAVSHMCGTLVNLTAYSEDAKEFIETEAVGYGRLLPDGDKYLLVIGDGFDITEVVEYFKSYNDEDEQS